MRTILFLTLAVNRPNLEFFEPFRRVIEAASYPVRLIETKPGPGFDDAIRAEIRQASGYVLDFDDAISSSAVQAEVVRAVESGRRLLVFGADMAANPDWPSGRPMATFLESAFGLVDRLRHE